MVKIVFLDMDGVMNSASFIKRTGGIRGREGKYPEVEWWASQIDPDTVKRLNQIIEDTGAHIVISSSWRIGAPLEHLQEILLHVGVNAEVIDVTPGMPYDERGDEICAWIKDCSEAVDSFVVLDDSDDMGAVLDNLVRTDYETGLLDEHVEKAIAMLNKGV